MRCAVSEGLGVTEQIILERQNQQASWLDEERGWSRLNALYPSSPANAE